MIKVKALEFVPSTRKGLEGVLVAYAGDYATYFIDEPTDGGYRLVSRSNGESGYCSIGKIRGLNKAKAACQAHHEQHVLSMITEVADGAE